MFVALRCVHGRYVLVVTLHFTVDNHRRRDHVILVSTQRGRSLPVLLFGGG